MKLNLTRLFFVTFAFAAFASGAGAQGYPTRPVKIVVGYVAGGGPDTVARALAQKMGEILGQPFVVENRPGAGGTLATGIVAKSPADGYTLLAGETGQLVIAPHIYKTLSYNTLKDFTPIGLASSESVFLVASPKSNLKTMADLIRESKTNPGKISYGSSGVGTIHHITAEVFMQGAGIDMQHIPYKGSSQSVPAILAGDIPVLMSGFGSVAPHIRSGKLNLLAITTAKRPPSMPDAPIIGDLIAGYDFPSETGLLAPAGLPGPVLAKLSNAIKLATESPEFIARFKDTGTMPSFMNPSEYTENLKTNLKKYEQAVSRAKIQPE
jgi:tripartite-type tricarboxylate transporter receptor subunit TctC